MMRTPGFLTRIWPFRNISKRAPLLPGERSGDGDAGDDSFYVSRPGIEKAVASVLARGQNLVIYGPPHQGKTMLLARRLAADDAIYIECRPGFKRTQIYRVILSALGYAVLVEKKKRGKATTTVKLGIASTSAEASAQGEFEHVMQSVTVDLRNPSEVAHLITRIRNLPWLVLNNFHLLDSGTKRNLLFDLTFFAERPNLRIIIVGSWSSEDYLEEIEPAVAGRFRYVHVPTWTDAELRRAAAQWSADAGTPDKAAPRLDEFLALAAGDIALFRALVDGSAAGDESAPRPPEAPADGLPIQEMVLGRFRRGLRTRLRAIFAQRDAYLTFLSPSVTSRLVINPEFQPVASESNYRRTSIDPHTNRPYSGGHTVRLDLNGNPEYLEETVEALRVVQTDVVRFLLRTFHEAVRRGDGRIELDTLVRAFAEQQLPPPAALDDAKLKTVFRRFDEVQRQVLIVPPMLAVDGTGEAMEIVDRRLALFLQSVGPEDLEELFDEAQPRVTPSARRRNHVSTEKPVETRPPHVTWADPESEEFPDPDQDLESDPDEVDEDDWEIDDDGREAAGRQAV